MDLSLADERKQSLDLVIQCLINQQSFNHSTFQANGDINRCSVSGKFINTLLSSLQQDSNKFLHSLGDIDHIGSFSINGNDFSFEGTTKTDLGILTENIQYSRKLLDGHLSFRNFSIEKLITGNSSASNNDTGKLDVTGTLSPLRLNIISEISQLTFNKYPFHDLSISGNITDNCATGNIDIRDKNLNLSMTPHIVFQDNHLTANINAIINKLVTRELHLTDVLKDNIISSRLQFNLQSTPYAKNADLALSHLCLENKQKSYTCDTLHLTYSGNNTSNRIRLTSDIFDAHLSSGSSIQDIPNSLLTFASSAIPALKRHVRYTPNRQDIDFSIKFKNTGIFNSFLDLPLEIEKPADIKGYIDHKKNSIQLMSWLPKFKINDEQYSDGTFFLKGNTDSLHILTQFSKWFDDSNVKMVLNVAAADNIILPTLEWKTINSNGTSGNLNLKCKLYGQENLNKIADILVHPSTFTIHDTLWSVSSSDINITPNGIYISPLELRNGEQFISIRNKDSFNSPFLITLNGMEISHIQDLLNFHPVEFSGNIYGTATIPSKSSGELNVPLDISVRNFHFQGGEMGTLHILGNWDDATKQINLDAITRQSLHDSLVIKGYVDIDADSLEINFSPRHTNAEFLNSWLYNVLGPIKGNISGQLKLSGPLDALDLTGKVMLDTLSFTPPVTNALYTMSHDSIFFREGKIIFQDFHIHDAKHGSCVVIGDITHNKLKDFGYNLSFDANNLLAYNHSSINHNDFWGTVYADGNGRLYGNTSTVHADLNLSPKYGSRFFYNSSETENASGSDFIYFHNGKTQYRIQNSNDNKRNDEIENFKDNSTDIYFNLLADINPNAEIIIYTDWKTGDGLYLRGNGPFDISWHNKGKFRINGLFSTTGGEYHLTIQDLMKRNFQIKPDGYLRFSGNAEDGDLNLVGVYTVHSVSLSDLNIGQNISNATTNVNCLLNFGGKTNNPQVTFGLDFPTAGDDMRQTLRSAISSQEDLNMQMLYLLTVGRFYTYDYETSSGASAQNQSVIAMQSLFANTLGKSLGSIISQALHLRNWTFGPNISTGRLGFDDMEVGGQFQGSLLQNRLQLSGNFGYRDQNTYANNFVGDFNLRWLLNQKGTISLNAYSETNDRYFSKSSLSTQGGGIMFQRDFNKLRNLFYKQKNLK